MMKNILLLLVTLFIACTTNKPTTTYMKYNKLYSKVLVDSIIASENILGLSKMPLLLDNDTIYEYFYIKDSVVIRFIEKGDSIQVTKRINK